jgi:hypothetical protein
LRVGHFKLVVNCKTGARELFNLATDIGESKNLAMTMPEKTTEMATVLDTYLKSVNAETPNAKASKKQKGGDSRE